MMSVQPVRLASGQAEVEAAPVDGASERASQVPVEFLGFGESPRHGALKADHLEALIAAGGGWPPLLVRRSSLVVIDGRYRLEAARRLHLATVWVDWFDGDDVAAAIEAVRRNVSHGLPLTLTERKAAAVGIVECHPEWSDGRIARTCGLSPKTVARLRPAGPADAQSEEAIRRIGLDGKYRPMRSKPARQRVVDLLDINAHASLREIAAQALVSHETVRTVRNQLQKREVDNRDDVTGAGPTTAENAPWSADSACSSTSDGRAFAMWFDAHALETGALLRFADAVPLSRVYEVIDESCRRGAMWNEFAEALRRRIR